MYAGEQEIRPRITPSLLFVGDAYGKAEDALGFYTSVFADSTIDHLLRYGPGAEPDREDAVQHAGFTLEGNTFAAMDSAAEHNFGFNESISFMIECADQAEIDHFWTALSAVPEAEQCGWLKDRFGVSWQVVPARMEQMMRTAGEEQLGRVTKAFLQMKKFDLAELERAYRGE